MSSLLYSLQSLRWAGLGVAGLLLLGAIPDAFAKPTAFLVLSGKAPSKHNCQMFSNFEKGIQSFSAWNRVVLVDNGPNTTEPNIPVCDPSGKFPQFDATGQPLYEHRMPKGPPPVAGAANILDLTAQLREHIKTTRPGDPIVIYIASHGSRSNGSSHSELWGHSVSPDRMRDLLRDVPKDRKLILIHDQCRGAGMLEELWERNGELRPNTCGFTSAREDEQAWTREFIMDSVNRVVERKRNPDSHTLQTGVTFADAFQHATDVVNVHSTPVSSSGYFLNKYLRSRLGVKQLSKAPLSSICAECTGHASGVPTSVSPALLSQISLLKQDFAEFTRKAGITGSPTAAMLESKNDELGTRLDAVYKEKVRLEALLAKARTDFARSKVGEARYQRYADQKKSIEKLKAELIKRPDSGKQVQLERLTQEFGVTERELSHHRSAAAQSSAEFQAFLANNAKSYPPDIYALIEHKAAEKFVLIEQTTKLRKAFQAATQLTALEVILKTYDKKALNQYLSLLSCESTLIEDKPPLHKRIMQ